MTLYYGKGRGLSLVIWSVNRYTDVCARTQVGICVCVRFMYMYACMLAQWHSRVQIFVNPWTAAHQAAQSMGFSRQEYWSGVPLPSLKNTPGWTQIGVIHFIAVQSGSQCPMGVQSVSSLDSQP